MIPSLPARLRAAACCLAAVAILPNVAGAEGAIVAPPPSTATTPAQPPKGSKEDQTLWMAGYETQTSALLEQDRARSAVLRLSDGKYYDRLGALGKDRPAAREAADGAARKLAAAAAEVSSAGMKPPFDLRTGCRYQLVGLGNAMATADAPNGPANLAAARTDLTKCRDVVERWRVPLARADDALEAALAEADDVLRRAATEGASSAAASSPSAGGR